MTRKLSESAVVRALADQACKRLSRKMIATLQTLDDGLLSGEDSGLKNTWDEICAQVQSDYSHSWDVYDEMVRTLAASHVEELLPHEREAIWLQTTAGEEWGWEDESERDPYPVVNDEIADYVVNDYVYREAGSWSNQRLRDYLYRSFS